MPVAPVSLNEEERKVAELEAAVSYWQGLIELRLRRGEDVPEEDPLFLQLVAATDAFQRGLEPHLTLEEIVELE